MPTATSPVVRFNLSMESSALRLEIDRMRAMAGHPTMAPTTARKPTIEDAIAALDVLEAFGVDVSGLTIREQP